MLTVERIKEVVAKVGEKYVIKNAYFFDSYAKGTANEDSDVDILIDKGEIKGLQLSGFRLDLIDELGGADIDVVTEKSTRGRFLQLINNDRTLIYGV